ncbi:MAG: bifunctional nuclease family protein [Elusimicrobiales bacterium]|jgi:bifunctional DNase/RNase|nr:bifunctional nuclease family protein [Elusimicrobiales bacterium]
MKEIPVKIYSIASSLTESIIFLDEVDGIRILPIWIGPFEAQSIAIKMSGYVSPRPMTHDLLYKVIRDTGARVTKVLISGISENTYFSKIYISYNDNKTIEIDSRPSDAIALSVRSGSPIYISEDVFEHSQVLAKPISDDEIKTFKEKLKNLTPKDIIGDNPPKKEKEGKDEQETDN